MSDAVSDFDPTGAGPARAAPVWALPAPCAFRVVETEAIPLGDGTQLAARLWLPEHAVASPVPVVLEYLPYRRRDFTRARDDTTGPYLARHGIAFARVDMRGSGDARGGLLAGEYLEAEQADGLEVLRWLARQPWCNGSVGMRGKSWGGFNALQLAALAPPELKAIMPMCFADNRYTDDAHYIGGALALANFQWGTACLAVMAAPPDPQTFGAGWLDEWRQRLEAAPPLLAQWLAHQRFDAFWQHASVAPAYERIRCPVYCVGGWQDAYNDSIPRALARLTVPRKALIGPWGHLFPTDGSPGPALQWAHEEVRWWHHWLNGVDTGLMAEPMFRAYMPTSTATQSFPADTPGRWIAEAAWPSPQIAAATVWLHPGALGTTPLAPGTIRFAENIPVGAQRSEWLPFDLPADLAKEQTPDDRASIVFDSAPLAADHELLGHPVLHVRLSADVPVAKLSARLMEVLPDGSSWQVTYGILNLTHRAGHEHPEPLQPGVFYDVELSLKFIAHVFQRGSRIRLALSESLWPMVWPSPTPVTLTIETGTSCLRLPWRTPPEAEAAFSIPEIRAAAPSAVDASSLAAEASPTPGVIERSWPAIAFRIDSTGTRFGAGWRHWRMTMTPGEPNSCVWQGDFEFTFERGDWGDNRVHASFELRSTASTFMLQHALRADRNGERFFERRWEHRIERDAM